MDETPERNTATAQGNTDDDAMSISDCDMSPSKRASWKRTRAHIKSIARKSTHAIRTRFGNLRTSPSSTDESEEKTVTFGSGDSQYSLSESQILDAAAEILLNRIDNQDFPRTTSLRCPCCGETLGCSHGHKMEYIPEELDLSFKVLLTNIFAEGVCITSEINHETRWTEQGRRATEAQPNQESSREPEKDKGSDEQQQPPPTPKRESKKRARSIEDDNAERAGAPASQRPRVTPKRPPPYKTRAATSGRKLTYAQRRQRFQDWENGIRPPSMFRLDEMVANHEAKQKEEEAAREAAEEERLEMISRAAMERHIVQDPVPDDMQAALQIPAYADRVQGVNAGNAETTDVPQTPASAWKFSRSLFNTVSQSVSRFVPRFGGASEDLEVPFGK